VFWHFAAITAQRRRIFLAVPPMSTVVVTSARPTQCRRWSFHQLNDQLGDRVFPVAVRAWNDLPPTIRASPSLLTFRQQLKLFSLNPHFSDLTMMGSSELN